MPYTIGVNLDDIETHGANTDATTSEQVVAPGVYVYGDVNEIVLEPFNSSFCVCATSFKLSIYLQVELLGSAYVTQREQAHRRSISSVFRHPRVSNKCIG